MIRKILILALLIYAAFFFYKKYIEPTYGTSFKQHMGKVDFFGTSVPNY